LTQLRDLYLGNTRITNAGLKHLKGLSHLRALCLNGTQVTDEGIKDLQQALPDCKIKR
jgi:internalin A